MAKLQLLFDFSKSFIRNCDFQIRRGLTRVTVDQGTLIRPEFREESTKQNHKRVMQPRSRIQTTGPNNGHQLRDYSKSSNRSESPLISMTAGQSVALHSLLPPTHTTENAGTLGGSLGGKILLLRITNRSAMPLHFVRIDSEVQNLFHYSSQP